MKSSLVYKRLILVVVFVCISVFCYGIINVIQKQEKSITTNALPITNKIVVIDAGHGKPDEGAFLLYKENKQLTFYKCSNRGFLALYFLI